MKVSSAIEPLEALVDSHGLVAVIESLSEICREKESHLTSSDQAKTWKHNAGYLDKVSATVWRQSWERY